MRTGRRFSFSGDYDGVRLVTEDEAARKAGSAAATAGGDPKALPSEDHQFVIDDCVDAIRENREVCIPCSSVRGTLELALGMYKSDKEKKAIELPFSDEDSIWA